MMPNTKGPPLERAFRPHVSRPGVKVDRPCHRAAGDGEKESGYRRTMWKPTRLYLGEGAPLSLTETPTQGVQLSIRKLKVMGPVQASHAVRCGAGRANETRVGGYHGHEPNIG